jgi:hypothetical protein
MKSPVAVFSWVEGLIADLKPEILLPPKMHAKLFTAFPVLPKLLNTMCCFFVVADSA